jgi:hypothetical protein
MKLLFVGTYLVLVLPVSASYGSALLDLKHTQAYRLSRLYRLTSCLALHILLLNFDAGKSPTVFLVRSSLGGNLISLPLEVGV